MERESWDGHSIKNQSPHSMHIANQPASRHSTESSAKRSLAAFPFLLSRTSQHATIWHS